MILPVQWCAAHRLCSRVRRGAALRTALTDDGGTFVITGVPSGTYSVQVTAPGFDFSETAVTPGTLAADDFPLTITLLVRNNASSVTVTAVRGTVENVDSSDQLVTVRDRGELLRKPLPTVGNSLEGAPGVMVQQTTYAASSPHLRGLTGYQTLLLVDGIRFNTSIFRLRPESVSEPGGADRCPAGRGRSGSGRLRIRQRLDGRNNQRNHPG